MDAADVQPSHRMPGVICLDTRRRPNRAEVFWFEQSVALQAMQIGYYEPALIEADQPVAAEVLQGPVDMDKRKTRDLADLALA